MAKSRKQLREEVRTVYVKDLMEYLSKNEDVMRTGSNEFAFPITDSEGNEDFIVITVKIPTGSNKGLEPYDGYSMAEEYKMKLETKKEKAKEKEIAKQKKIARDKKIREEKAKIAKEKEEREH